MVSERKKKQNKENLRQIRCRRLNGYRNKMLITEQAVLQPVAVRPAVQDLRWDLAADSGRQSG